MCAQAIIEFLLELVYHTITTMSTSEGSTAVQPAHEGHFDGTRHTAHTDDGLSFEWRFLPPVTVYGVADNGTIADDIIVNDSTTATRTLTTNTRINLGSADIDVHDAHPGAHQASTYDVPHDDQHPGQEYQEQPHNQEAHREAHTSICHESQEYCDSRAAMEVIGCLFRMGYTGEGDESRAEFRRYAKRLTERVIITTSWDLNDGYPMRRYHDICPVAHLANLTGVPEDIIWRISEACPWDSAATSYRSSTRATQRARQEARDKRRNATPKWFDPETMHMINEDIVQGLLNTAS